MDSRHCGFIKPRLQSPALGRYIMLLGISVISVAKPHLSPSLPAVQYLSVAKAGAAGLPKAGARL